MQTGHVFFLKYYIAYASVLLSKFLNHPVVFLVVAVRFTTIKANKKFRQSAREFLLSQTKFRCHILADFILM